ncbi:hypothetical protein BAUCODRAFT_118821 [Baudoinia panamericana UAMH 10762]|uniref:C2H2-type domain-containing protein n=1 Tax=Baudoinia panamericana (strain UAMH 10762) TaxID=717646 RepID=M2NA64_BAUPA|nr:uncharacterized protein BAUCODRAFT_118821 [Baudoinia panamericana UAMH 10762]EMD01109.1 hypothetical protein BAUCODRAFT_118821 [Baudoinia panamericana UAMH 10762]
MSCLEQIIASSTDNSDCGYFSHEHTTLLTPYGYENEPSYYPSSHPTHPITPTAQYNDSAIITHALALLQQPTPIRCMQNFDFQLCNPDIVLQRSTPTPAAFATPPVSYHTYDDWQMFNGNGVSAVSSHSHGLKRARTHQRTPSASTVASNGPASPYTHNFSNPHIANTDFAPHSPAQFADQAIGGFSKNLPTPSQTPTDSVFLGGGYLPSQAAHTGAAHQAMKGFLIDYHNRDFAPEPAYSSRTMSTNGNDSPVTPQSHVGDMSHTGQHALPQNDQQQNPNVHLWRTESQAYQDELYNPPTTSYSAAPAVKPASTFLSPHRNLVTERLQTANIARSHSPTSSLSRERSPFRDGSPLAPLGGWRSPGPGVGTAASLRHQQKEQADQAELLQHMPPLQREPTKTISPKDAVLDYDGPEQPSLFQDSIPAGYKPHNGATEQWPSNYYSQSGAAFGNLQAPSQQSYANFRATQSADGLPGGDAINFGGLPPSGQSLLQNGTSFDNTYAAPKMDSTPEFPAHLTTMESSISDNGPPVSSQDSTMITSALTRPSDTRAATGTYTCTYHGCTQRFESPASLQRHKRDYHRSQQRHRDGSGTASSAEASTSPPPTDSPGPAGAGLTSAALAARNSQAGPHKCMRTNPSTGKPCGTIFSRPYDLTRHEDTIHNNRKQKVRCPMCRDEKTFSRNDALTRHMRVVHPEVEELGRRKRGRD